MPELRSLKVKPPELSVKTVATVEPPIWCSSTLMPGRLRVLAASRKVPRIEYLADLLLPRKIAGDSESCAAIGAAGAAHTTIIRNTGAKRSTGRIATLEGCVS